MSDARTVSIDIDEIVIDLPPDLEVDREAFTKGLAAELARLIERQGLPDAALHDHDLVLLDAEGRERTSLDAGRAAGRSLYQGLSS